MNDTDKTEAQPAQIFITPPDQSPQRKTDAGGMNLMEYYYMLRSRPLLFLVFPVVFVLAAVIHVQTATPRYSADCRLLIEKAAKVTNIQGVYNPASGGRNFDTFIQTQIKLISSRETLVKVFDHFRFAERPGYRDHPDPLASFTERVTVQAEPNTSLVNVAFTSTDPQEAADIANFIGNTYVRKHRNRRLGISGSGIEKLRLQLEEMRKARADARLALNAFKLEKSLINLADAQKLLMGRMSSIDRVLINARTAETQIKSTLDVIDEIRKKGESTNLEYLSQVLKNPMIAMIKMEKLRAAARLPELLSRFSADHIVVKTQKQVLETLDKAFAQEIALSLASITMEYQRSQIRTSLLNTELDTLKTESLALDQVSGEYRVLDDAYVAAEKAYRMLINRINEVNIAKNADDVKGAGTVEIVSRAVRPVLYIYPNERRTVFLASFVGLAIGAGLCLLLGLLDSSVKGKEEVEDLLGRLPTLGSVPAFNSDKDQLQAVKESHCAVAEAFRHVRVSLGLSLLGRDKKTFAVTSAQPSEGKTTTAFNLALALARDGKKTLLLECDMRRPSFRKLLGDLAPTLEKGVSNVLIGDATLADVTWTFPEVDGLDMAFCGPVPPNPAELLGTDRLKTLLDDARAQYDMVIIDVPPVLNVADSSIIAGLGVPLITVVRLFSTSRHQLTRLKEQIDTVQGQVAGIVLNHAEAPKRGYYGYYYGGRYHTYSGYKYESDA